MSAANDKAIVSVVLGEALAEDVLTAEQRERRMREVEAEVAQLVGWGSEEARHRGSKALVPPFSVGQSS